MSLMVATLAIGKPVQPAGDGDYSHGGSTGGGGDEGAPVVTSVTPASYISSDRLGKAKSGQVVATVVTTGTPTGFSMVGGSGYFTVVSTGANTAEIRVTSTGATNIAPTKSGATYTASFTANNASGSSATSGPHSFKFYPDGALDAPVGTAQVPTLFSPYGRRPPWATAGVDYYVGVTSGTTLRNPTAGGLPSGTTYDAGTHTVTVSSPNTTFEAWDMSVSNGIGLVVNAANCIVQNCKFVTGSNARAPILVAEDGADCTIRNCYIDQAGIEDIGTFGGAIYVIYANTTRNLTIEYCDIKNGAADFIDIGAGLNLIRYNLMRNDGQTGGESHPDFTQSNPFSLPATYTPQIDFNTMVNTYGVAGPGGGQGCGIGDNECPVVGAASLDNNVMIANGPGDPGADHVSISYWCIVEYASLQSGATVSVQHNYADLTSAYGFGYSGGTGVHATWADNTDLNDGSALTPTP